MRFVALVLGSALAICAIVQQARADFPVDTFAAPAAAASFFVPQFNPSPYTLSTPVSGTTTRLLTITASGGANVIGSIGGGNVNAGAGGFGGTTSLSTFYAFSTPINFQPDGPGGAFQVTAFGDNGFGASIPISIAITTTTDSLTFSGSLTLTGSAVATAYPFSAFAGAGNLSGVTGVNVTFDPPSGADIVISRYDVVSPVPESGMLLVLALPAVLLRRL